MRDFLKEKISRYDFLKRGCQFLTFLGLSNTLLDLFSKNTEAKMDKEAILKEAMFYQKLNEDTVQCGICFRGCILKEGQRSFCRNKENRGGKLYNLVYAKPSAVHIDPIEKEPALHMLPGTDILCFGTAGCNFRCKFCQNWHLSQRPIEEMEYTHELLPEDAANFALKNKIPTLLNDNPKDVEKMCLWIKENLGPDTPLHLSRFSPAYKLIALSPTPIETLEKAYSIAREAGLNYVTIGNVPGHKYNSTFCPKCQKRLIHRIHFQVLSNNIKDGKCEFCEYKIAGIWN